MLAGGVLLYPTLPPPLIGLRFHQFSLDLLCAGLPGHSGPDTWGTWGTAVSSHHHGDTPAVAVCDQGDDCWVPGGHWPGCWVLGAGRGRQPIIVMMMGRAGGGHLVHPLLSTDTVSAMQRGIFSAAMQMIFKCQRVY